MPILRELSLTMAGPVPAARRRLPVRVEMPARAHHSGKRKTCRSLSVGKAGGELVTGEPFDET